MLQQLNALFFVIQIKLCSLGGKISDLRKNVKRKRIELAVLREMKTLTSVVEAQVNFFLDYAQTFAKFIFVCCIFKWDCYCHCLQF